MAPSAEDRDQQHPQEKRDTEIVERLLQQEPSDYNRAELARLRIRYCGFPGAREIQQNLDKVLQKWQLSEEELFEFTRQLHQVGQVYKRGGDAQGQDDWS
jgi:formate dehydrogenase assembly factor FdhD